MFRNEILENKINEVFQYIPLTGHIINKVQFSTRRYVTCSSEANQITAQWGLPL